MINSVLILDYNDPDLQNRFKNNYYPMTNTMSESSSQVKSSKMY